MLRAVTLKRHWLMVVDRAHSLVRPFGAGYSIILSMQKRHTEGEVDFMDSPRFSTRLARVLSAMENGNDLHSRTNAPFFLLYRREKAYTFLSDNVYKLFSWKLRLTRDGVLFYKLYL